MYCSVVVCTYHRPELLARCLRGISKLDHSNFEVLVVNNAPDDNGPRAIASRFSTRYILEPVRGLSRARNAGFRESRGVIVAYLDDDSIPEPKWLSMLEREFSDPDVMVATGRVVPLRKTAEYFDEASLALELWHPVRRAVDRSVPEWFEMANFGGIGDGGNMAFRRSAFEVWPGFDVRLGRGAIMEEGEEHYAFFSLVEQGYRAVYTPDAVVGHPTPQTAEAIRAAKLRALRAASAGMVMLFFEQPRYRVRLVRYILSGLRGKRRIWRNASETPQARVVSRSEVAAALLSGIALYLKLGRVREPAQLKWGKADSCVDSLGAVKDRTGSVQRSGGSAG
jgi:O-antigen biosynthesis protein